MDCEEKTIAVNDATERQGNMQLCSTVVPLHDLHPLDKQTLKAPLQPPAPRLPTPASSMDPIFPWPKTCLSVRESTMLYPRGLSAHPGYQRSAMQVRAQALS